MSPIRCRLRVRACVLCIRYGYDYPCLQEEMESESSKFCPLPFVPFRGVNCSDAAGSESGFASILEVMRSNKTVHPGRRWDASTMTPYFNYKDENGQSESRMNFPPLPRICSRTLMGCCRPPFSTPP